MMTSVLPLISPEKGAQLGFVAQGMMLAVSGVYYPVSVMPGWMQAIAKISPATYALRGDRASIVDGAGSRGPTSGRCSIIAVVAIPLGLVDLQAGERYAKKHGKLKRSGSSSRRRPLQLRGVLGTQRRMADSRAARRRRADVPRRRSRRCSTTTSASRSSARRQRRSARIELADARASRRRARRPRDAGHERLRADEEAARERRRHCACSRSAACRTKATSRRRSRRARRAFLLKGGLHDEVGDAIVAAAGRAITSSQSRSRQARKPVAPVRQRRRSRALAPQHGVRRPRRRAAELGGRDPPHAAVEPRLLEDRLRELRPRAVAVGGEMPEPARKRDELVHRFGEMPDERRRAALVVDDRDLVALRAEPQHRAHEVRCPSSRRATRCARSTRPRPPRPRRAASCARTPTAGSAHRTRRTAFASSRRRRSRSRSRRAARRARARAACRRRSPRPRPADRPRRRRRPSTRRRAARDRARRARGGGIVTSQSRVRQAARAGKRLEQRGAELPAGAGYDDASRAERIGDDVLQMWRTRSSSHGMPCSSGAAGSYSSVTRYMKRQSVSAS